MKQLKKILIVSALAIGLTMSAKADSTFSLTLTNSITNVISTAGINITKIIVQAGSTNSGVVNFYDANSQIISYTRGAYTNRFVIQTNLVKVITNSLAQLQTNTYPGIFTEIESVPAASVNYPVLSSIVVGVGASYVDLRNLITTQGLVAVPSTNNLTVTVYYNDAP